MSGKSLEYRLLYAINVARNDPNARVVIAVGTAPRARLVFDQIRGLAGDDFSFRLMSFEANHDSGSRVVVLPVNGELWHYGGWIMTHLWLDETLEPAARDMISTRQRARSNVEFVERPGIYDEYGVVRREDY